MFYLFVEIYCFITRVYQFLVALFQKIVLIFILWEVYDDYSIWYIHRIAKSWHGCHSKNFFLFSRSIRECEKKETVAERISDLNNHFTSIIYQSISRSLFQEHVLVFSFVLCVGILQDRGEVDENVWKYFLRGSMLNGGSQRDSKWVYLSWIIEPKF